MPKYINADEMIIDENEAYIKAQAKPKEYVDFLVNQVVHLKLQMLLADAPAADVQEVRHGKWDENIIGFCNVCLECGAIVDRYAIKNNSGKLNYCPNCGAKMDGKE